MTEDSMGSGRPRKNTRKSNGNNKYVYFFLFFYKHFHFSTTKIINNNVGKISETKE